MLVNNLMVFFKNSILGNEEKVKCIKKVYGGKVVNGDRIGRREMIGFWRFCYVFIVLGIFRKLEEFIVINKFWWDKGIRF